LKLVPYSNRFQFRKFVEETTDPKTEAIYTDENINYLAIEDSDTRHETVKHSEEQWVCGDVHTNTVEGVWSLFKRSVIGTDHKLSAKHLDPIWTNWSIVLTIATIGFYSEIRG